MQQLLPCNLVRSALNRTYSHLFQGKRSPFSSLSRSACSCGDRVVHPICKYAGVVFKDMDRCYLRINGFSMPQIAGLSKIFPMLLNSMFQPRIEFFRSKGLSGRQVAKVISSCPTLLTTSLENQIVPAYDALNSFLQFDSNSAAVIKNCPELLLKDVDSLLVRNCNLLYGCGVPRSNVIKLLTASPWIISMEANNLKEIVERLRDEMGFDPSKYNFREALGVLTRMTWSQWESKLDVIKKWGLSEEQVIAGFRRFPKFMTVPEEKINRVIELSVCLFGWDSSAVIASYPKVLASSYHWRFQPRITLLSHRVWMKSIKREDVTPALLLLNDKSFMQKFFSSGDLSVLGVFPKRLLVHVKRQELQA